MAETTPTAQAPRLERRLQMIEEQLIALNAEFATVRLQVLQTWRAASMRHMIPAATQEQLEALERILQCDAIDKILG